MAQSIQPICYATSLTATDILSIKAARKDGITKFTQLVSHCNLDHKLLAVANYLGIPRENVAKYVHPRIFCRVETYLSMEGVTYPPGFIDLLHKHLGASFSTQRIYSYAAIHEAFELYASRLTSSEDDYDNLTV